jgi:hypothetical protein
LNRKKPGVSLEKRPRRSGMHGSDPLDHDPAAKDITFRDLICATGNGSDGQDRRKRGAAALVAGALCFTAATSPEFGKRRCRA